MRCASIDIGSNSAILLVAEYRDGAWCYVSDHVEVTRVSEGLDQSGRLDDGPVARTAEVLRAFRAEAAAAGVDRVVATGTAPFRRATNGAEAANVLADALGTMVDVVSGEEEARLAMRATQVAFPHLDALTIVDIGGASTEVITVRGGQHDMVSMDVGTVRLTERIAPGRALAMADRGRGRDEILRAMEASGVNRLLQEAPHPLVGIAGTVTTLATIHMGMRTYDQSRVHGSRLARADLATWDTNLWQMSAAERLALDGLPPKRADVIPMGALLLGMIADAIGVDHVIVSDRGVRWGRLAGIEPG